jgi:hypothetical protein
LMGLNPVGAVFFASFCLIEGAQERSTGVRV